MVFLDVFIQVSYELDAAVYSELLAESDESTLHIGTFHYFRRYHRDKRMVRWSGVSQLIMVLPWRNAANATPICR